MQRIADLVGDLSRIAAGIPFEIAFVLAYLGEDITRATMQVAYDFALLVAPFDAGQHATRGRHSSTVNPNLFAEQPVEDGLELLSGPVDADAGYTVEIASR